MLKGVERKKEEQEEEFMDMVRLEEELIRQTSPHLGRDGLIHLSAIFKPTAPLHRQIYNVTHRSPQVSTVHQKKSGEPRE